MQLTVPDTTSFYDAPRKVIPVDHSRGVSAMLDFLGADMKPPNPSEFGKDSLH